MRTIFPLMAVSLVLALPPAASAQEARPPIVAVMNIEAVGVTLPAPVLDRLTLFLTTRLGATNRFLVVPREQVKRRLVELKKNSYRADCDQSCQIDLGQALSAQKTVATQIIKAGSACTVAINVLDLKREASEGGASIDGKCDEDGIVLSLKAAVARMAGDAAASKPAPVGGAGPGGAAGPAQAVDSTSGAPAACPPGQAIGQDTAGHCCWPAQAWNGSACVGRPASCPEGHDADAGGCTLKRCRDGETRPDGVHCCWPGQAWASSTGKCVGVPSTCPTGLDVYQETCSDARRYLGRWTFLHSGSVLRQGGDGSVREKFRTDEVAFAEDSDRLRFERHHYSRIGNYDVGSSCPGDRCRVLAVEPGPEGITVTTQWMEDKPSVTVYRLDPAGKRLFGLAPGKALQPDFDAIAARHLQPDASGNTWFTYATRTEQGGSAR